ncbi:50S ribosomal protein L32 [Candidatus Babeliales bacterium]|nr:50S ribosomal protein L32 [Candidatus Babeliales bacterium]
MPVPKRKRSRARRDKRFANKGVKAKSFGDCSNCKQPVMPHQVCQGCGFYGGRKIMVTKQERAQLRKERQKTKRAAAPQAAAPESQGE